MLCASALVTGNADMEVTIEALRQGVSDFLLKPIDAGALRASMIRVAKLKQAQQRAFQAERLAAVRLVFHDNGPGLSIEVREKIFEPFFTTKSKGTGLGMAIAKRIIEAHGGRIVAANGQSGAEFIITLPRRLIPQEQDQRKGEESPTLEKEE